MTISRVGIIGYGRISRDLAPVLAALGMKVMVSDPYAQVDDRRFLKLPLEEMLGLADYVICLAIANEETENLMNAAMFARMKPDAFFINMSRGNLIDEAALMKVLQEGRIVGAAMDVAFTVNGETREIEVFTTRADTLFGAKFVALAADHPLAQDQTDGTRAEAKRAC